ncbi:M55 family metallopeptidase [Leifsonia sp. fls2-241-R2A-40a]|uniref:M55 family metallopeptidase n=1 Tax=Leifsonia sp. fls2-241-R2A-40a TaxID=3040290 RepID=UPI00254DD954|nr:M55 family metallopeptidase [Leifsonia sp. fls2-241-R2A-40a]
MRVLVSVDMEGIAGVVDRSDIAPGGPGWERARELMTDEASAAVRGVFAADDEAEVTVCDSHAKGLNLLPDRLDPRARLIRGIPRPLDMVAGVDRGVDAVLLIGYHGRAGLADAVLPHTLSGRTIDSVRMNGMVLGEVGLSAAVANSHGARTVLVTGDDAATREAAEVLPGVTSVTVKRALGVRAADSVHPTVACALIEAAVPDAVAATDTGSGLAFDGAVDLEVDVRLTEMMERLLLIPGSQRRGPRTFGYPDLDLSTAYGLVGLVADIAEIA